ncbi:MAG TPA: hypothetical protein VFW14_03810 [Gaiellales bacterium]|nr:hypothetical protein [Gaiellales bacterium]
MRIGTLIAIGAAAAALAAAGCGAGAAGSASQTHGPATHVTVVYSVGRPVHRRSQVDARCPAFARCRPARALGSWVLQVTRRLSCDPAAGGYARPADACAALLQYARLVHDRPANVCMCPAMFGIPGRASGVLAGRPVRLDLTPCAACGLGRHATADVQLLTAP